MRRRSEASWHREGRSLEWIAGMRAARAKNPWFFNWLTRAQDALRHGQIRATTFTVLVVLSQFADYATGQNARPGLDRLARDTGLSRRTVTDALKAGEAAGLIRQVRRGFGNAGTGTTSVYEMVSSPKQPGQQAPPPATAPATASATGLTLPRDDRGLTKVTKPQHGTGKLKKVRPPRAKLDWERVGLTQEIADDRGLTVVDYRNFLYLADDDHSA